MKEFKERRMEYALGSLIVALVVASFVVKRSLSRAADNEIHGHAHTIGNNMLVVPADTDMTRFHSFRYDGASMPDTYPKHTLESGAGVHIRAIQPVLYRNLAIGSMAAAAFGSVIAALPAAFAAYRTDHAAVLQESHP